MTDKKTGEKTSTTPTWERQKGESNMLYSYFVAYRESQPPRSHAVIAERFGRSIKYINKVASRWKWRDRLAEYQIHLQLESREYTEELYIKCLNKALETELEASETLNQNMKSIKKRQQGDKKFSQATLAGILRDHERAMTDHIQNFHLLCGRPGTIPPDTTRTQGNRVIQENQTDEELRNKLDKLLEEGSAETNTNTQQEDKE